jgi:RNA polymerase sigma-70 factor (ECF subfamily)
MTEAGEARDFEGAAPRLRGLAYRLLGSWADAEDAVQDTFLKWEQADKGRIENPASWLTAVCTRRCLDMLKAAHRTRVDYVGAWLPEPIHTRAVHAPDDAMELAATLQTAFLLLLERLTPKERAAYLLYEIFEMPYPEIAATLGIQEAACRKLVSRARANVDQARVRHVTARERQEKLIAAFEAAIAGRGTDRLVGMLSEEIELCADGGGKVTATRSTLRGKAAVLRFVERGLRRFWADDEWQPADLNGAQGVVLRRDGAVTASMSFGYDEDGMVTRIFIVRNPDKLARLGELVPGANGSPTAFRGDRAEPAPNP